MCRITVSYLVRSSASRALLPGSDSPIPWPPSYPPSRRHGTMAAGASTNTGSGLGHMVHSIGGFRVFLDRAGTSVNCEILCFICSKKQPVLAQSEKTCPLVLSILGPGCEEFNRISLYLFLVLRYARRVMQRSLAVPSRGFIGSRLTRMTCRRWPLPPLWYAFHGPTGV